VGACVKSLGEIHANSSRCSSLNHKSRHFTVEGHRVGQRLFLINACWWLPVTEMRPYGATTGHKVFGTCCLCVPNFCFAWLNTEKMVINKSRNMKSSKNIELWKWGIYFIHKFEWDKWRWKNMVQYFIYSSCVFGNVFRRTHFE